MKYPGVESMWREAFRRHVEAAISAGEWTPPPGGTVDDVVASIEWGVPGTQILSGEPEADGSRRTLTVTFDR